VLAIQGSLDLQLDTPPIFLGGRIVQIQAVGPPPPPPPPPPLTLQIRFALGSDPDVPLLRSRGCPHGTAIFCVPRVVLPSGRPLTIGGFLFVCFRCLHFSLVTTSVFLHMFTGFSLLLTRLFFLCSRGPLAWEVHMVLPRNR